MIARTACNHQAMLTKEEKKKGKQALIGGEAFRYPGGPYIFGGLLLSLLFAGAFFGRSVLPYAFLFFLLLFLYFLFMEIYERFYRLEDISDARFYAPTKDGWNIAMRLHRPDTPRKGSYPIILSHGLASNEYSLDLNRSLSLAYFLKQAGYTVFVLSLRGASKSYHNSLLGYKDFSFDDIVEYDVPAVIQRIRELTGASKVNWVGHSMGAMIAQAFLGRRLKGHEDVASFVSLGAPAHLKRLRDTHLGKLAKYYHIRRFISLRFSSFFLAPFFARINTPFNNLAYNKEDIDKETIKDLLKNSVEDIAPSLALQFSRWIRDGKWNSLDASLDYVKSLKGIHLPTLFLAGMDDKLSPPQAVRIVWKKISSRKKRIVVLSKKNGFSTDYCHTGLILGKKAPKEVFPMVLDWLERYGCERPKPHPKKALRKKH